MKVMHMTDKGMSLSFCLLASVLFAAAGPRPAARHADLRDALNDASLEGTMDSASGIETPAVPAPVETVPGEGAMSPAAAAEARSVFAGMRAKWTVPQAEYMTHAVTDRQLKEIGLVFGPGSEAFARKKLQAVRGMLKRAKAHVPAGSDVDVAADYMATGFAGTLFAEPTRAAAGYSKTAGYAGRGVADLRFAALGFEQEDMARIRAVIEKTRGTRDAAGYVHGWQGNARQALNPYLRRLGIDREIPDSGCSSWAFASVDALRADGNVNAKFAAAAIYGWKLLPHFVALVWPRGADPRRNGIYVDAWAGRTDIGTLGEWRRFYSFIDAVSPDGGRECRLDDWAGDFSVRKCWQP